MRFPLLVLLLWGGAAAHLAGLLALASAGPADGPAGRRASQVPPILQQSQGVAPQPKSTSIPRSKQPSTADGQDTQRFSSGPGDATKQRALKSRKPSGNEVHSVAELQSLLSEAEARAKSCAQRAEAAQLAARMELDKITQIENDSKEKAAAIHEMQSGYQGLQERAERAEAAVTELQNKLQATDQKVKILETSNRELLSAKGSLAAKLQKLENEHAAVLRRESIDKDTLRRAAEIVSSESKAQAEPTKPSEKTSMLQKLEAVLAGWIPESLGSDSAAFFQHHSKRASAVVQEVLALSNQVLMSAFGQQWVKARRGVAAFTRRASKDARRLQAFLAPMTDLYLEFEAGVERYLKSRHLMVDSSPQSSRVLAVGALVMTGTVGITIIRCLFNSRGARPAPRTATTERSSERKDSAGTAGGAGSTAKAAKAGSKPAPASSQSGKAASSKATSTSSQASSTSHAAKDSSREASSTAVPKAASSSSSKGVRHRQKK